MYIILTYLPGEPGKTWLIGGGDPDLGGVPAKKFGGPLIVGGDDVNGGGDAGDGGPPLEHPGGLMRFSFWRLERDQA